MNTNDFIQKVEEEFDKTWFDKSPYATADVKEFAKSFIRTKLLEHEKLIREEERTIGREEALRWYGNGCACHICTRHREDVESKVRAALTPDSEKGCCKQCSGGNNVDYRYCENPNCPFCHLKSEEKGVV